MPIDHIISPEQEVSSTVERQLRLPGAFDVKDMADGKVQLIGVLAKSNCPILSTPIRHLTGLFPRAHTDDCCDCERLTSDCAA